MLERWKWQAKNLRTETHALYLAYRDPRVSWYAKLTSVCVVAYALSPIDLIPDFVPVLGYLDDLILVPIGIIVARRMIPDHVMQECREKARQAQTSRPNLWLSVVLVFFGWVVFMGLIVLALFHLS